MGTGRGLGKIIFFGEHAAVHGYPALGASLPWKISVEHESTDEEVWEFPGLPPGYKRPLQDALKSLEDSLGHRARRGILRLRSDLPVGAGFGSSGALCAALVQALAPGSFQENWRMAHDMERNFHGKPSGIDTALALREGITAFTPQDKGLPKPETLEGFPLHLVLGALPRASTTMELVQGIRNQVEEKELPALAALQSLGDLAATAIASLKNRSATPFLWGSLADKAQEHLANLGLSTPRIEEVLASGRKNGALGGKLSGAGGGGAFFLVYPDAPSAQAGKQSLLGWAELQSLLWACAPEAFRWDADLGRLTLGRSAFDALFG